MDLHKSPTRRHLWIEALHPDDRDRVLNEFTDVDVGQVVRSTYRIRTVDDQIRWVVDEGTVEIDKDRDAPVFSGVITDITDFESIRQEQERFWSNSIELLAVCNFDAYFTRLNPRWSETLGYSVEELYSRPLFDFVHPDDRAMTEQVAARLFEGEDVVEFENRYVCKDGSYRWLQWASTIDSDLELSFGVARDVTDKKNAERVLRLQLAVTKILSRAISTDDVIAELLQALGDELGSYSSGYWELETDTGDLVCKNVYCSDERYKPFVELTENLKLKKDGPLVGLAWRSGLPVHLDLTVETTALLTRALAVEEANFGSAVAIPIGMHSVSQGVLEFFLPDPKSENDIVMQGLKLVATSIQQFFERKLAEESAERQKDEFFALVSHEMKTPLTSILGYVDLLKESTNFSDAEMKFVSTIDRNASRLERLISDILLAAKYESSNLALEFEETNLVDLVKSSYSAAMPAAASRDISLTVDTRGHDSLLANIDSDRIGQVVDNLLANALKFTPTGGKVTLSIRSENGYARVDVSDSGPGIPKEDQERIFERFFRADKAVADAVPGIGLGLTISKSIVIRHGGEIDVESTVGEGTTFTVQLRLLKEMDT